MALTTNLQSYYKLDSNSNDSVGGINGTDTSVTYTPGKISNAATMTNGVIDLGTGNFSVSNEITISFWVYFNDFSSGQILIQKSNGISAASDSWYVYLVNSGYIQTLISNGSSNYYANFNSGFSLSSATWYHLTFTYDQTSGTQKLYLNGSLINSIGTGSVTINSTASSVLMGRFKTGSVPLRGKIDEVGIWNRAITSTEVSELYNSGTGLSYPFTSSSNTNPAFLSQYLAQQ